MTEVPVFDLKRIKHKRRTRSLGEHYEIPMFEKCRSDTLRLFPWPEEVSKGGRQGAFGAIQLYQQAFAKKEGLLRTFARRGNGKKEVPLTYSRYIKDLEIVSRRIHSKLETGEDTILTAKNLRKVTITAFATIHPMLKVAYYTRNTIRTISRYYFTPKTTELAEGRISVAQLFEREGEANTESPLNGSDARTRSNSNRGSFSPRKPNTRSFFSSNALLH